MLRRFAKALYSGLLMLSLASLLISQSAMAEGVKLRIVTQDFPPYAERVDGKVTGIATEIVLMVCHKMQAHCDIKLLPWRRAILELRQGSAHAGFVMGITPERKQWLHFSEPIFHSEYGFFSRIDSGFRYQQPSDLEGYTIAVYGPSSTSHSLEKLVGKVKQATIVIRPDDRDGFRQLPRGRVDAVYSNYHVGLRMISRSAINGVHYAGKHRDIEYVVGFSKRVVSPDVVAAFNRAYEELDAEGAFQWTKDPEKVASID